MASLATNTSQYQIFSILLFTPVVGSKYEGIQIFGRSFLEKTLYHD